jgi:alkane 1-monooxygenase
MGSDFKYLLAYLAPLAAFIGVYYGGYLSPGSFYVAFVCIPLIETLMPKSAQNLSSNEEERRLGNKFFDVLLYSHLPILTALIIFYFIRINAGGLSGGEIAWMTLSVGIIVGSFGINIAHELGHRANKTEQTLAKILLLPALYMHFFIEHNRGHHLNIGTPEDPATSRLGENVYQFFFRSVTLSWLSAWTIENKRLEKSGLSKWSFQNEMLVFQIIQISYLAIVALVFSPKIMLFAILIGVIGFLTLELVNYIEHYGLVRKRNKSGRYERVLPKHSWNSDHELGRIFLYELSRHSDHHFKSTRKYQVLRHFQDSPQLPLGYPASMLLSLIPPLWFKVMDKEVEKWNAMAEC